MFAIKTLEPYVVPLVYMGRIYKINVTDFIFNIPNLSINPPQARGSPFDNVIPSTGHMVRKSLHGSGVRTNSPSNSNTVGASIIVKPSMTKTRNPPVNSRRAFSVYK